MSDNKLDQPPPKATVARAPANAVIRHLDAAEETSQERLLRKHVPAWVVSGAMHVVVVSLMFLLFNTPPADSKPAEKPVEVSEQKTTEDPVKNLVDTDKGLESELPSAVPDITRVAEKTVKEKETDDVIGQPDAKAIDFNALTPPGVANLGPSGAAGETGPVDKGVGGGGMVSAEFAGRGGATKERLLREGGGNKDSELAVALGLNWLALQQKHDPRNTNVGWWEFDEGSRKPDYSAKNTPAAKQAQERRNVELRALATGFALLPFLAAGQTHKPDADGTPKKYQQVVAKGLNYLKGVCPLAGANAGKLSDNMYEQAIAALPLVEAYGMTRDPALYPYAQAVVNYIQRAQGPKGSWGYSAHVDGDTSIVGWQIQVLAAAKLAKLVVDDQVVRKAMKFLDSVADGSKKAYYGYTKPEKRRTLTPVGLLCRYYMDGWGPKKDAMTEGVEFLMQQPPPASGEVRDLYYYYYATQVVHFAEGESWRTWNEGPARADGTRAGGVRDWLVKAQVTGKDPSISGSWNTESGWFGDAGGRICTTAVVLLTLEVYYRHLPLYKRGSDPGATQFLDK